MNRPLHWPLHPRPGPLESLSSWLRRIASLHGLSVKDLLVHNLDLPDVPRDIDDDPPAVMPAALAERTGVDPAQLRATTLTGWVPWLFDMRPVRPEDQQHLFDTYVRANPVLLAPADADTHRVDRWKRWAGPWLPDPKRPLRRVCPVCVAGPDHGSALVWTLPLMLGCVEHSCWLENAEDLELSLPLNQPPLAPRQLDEPLATLDRYTHSALTTGRVDMPGRPVHAGVWFRLLRSLLHEVSLAPTTLHAHGRSTLRLIWQATGRPERGGLSIWKPYEHLPWNTQEAMLHAAAAALHLAADEQITARGRLASVLAPPRPHVYDGDPPDRPGPERTAMAEFMTQLEAAIEEARTDRAAARQLLSLLTLGFPTLARVKEQRAVLLDLGIPAEFLPSVGEVDHGQGIVAPNDDVDVTQGADGPSSIPAASAVAWEESTWSTRSAASMNDVDADERRHTMGRRGGALPSAC